MPHRSTAARRSPWNNLLARRNACRPTKRIFFFRGKAGLRPLALFLSSEAAEQKHCFTNFFLLLCRIGGSTPNRKQLDQSLIMGHWTVLEQLGLIPTNAPLITCLVCIFCLAVDPVLRRFKSVHRRVFVAVCLYGLIGVALFPSDDFRFQVRALTQPRSHYLVLGACAVALCRHWRGSYLILCCAEELVARYYVVNVFYSIDGNETSAVVYSAVCFAAAHLYHRRHALTAASFGLGLVNGILFVQTQDLAFCVGLHYVLGTLFVCVTGLAQT